jgi:hypothetical protein
MRWHRLDVWDGNPADKDGEALEAAIRFKAGSAVGTLDNVAELLEHAHRTGRFNEREAVQGVALVREITRLRWLLTATLLQPNQQQESERNGTA